MRHRVFYIMFVATHRVLQAVKIPRVEGNNSLCSTRGNPFNISTGISKISHSTHILHVFQPL